MKETIDLKDDLESVSDNVLGDLGAEERIRMYVKAAAKGQDERLKRLRESAPSREYRLPDLGFTQGTKEVYVLSMLANYQLERLHTALMMHETARDKLVASVLLNEAIERLSQGHFTVDEYGDVNAPSSWPHNYGPQYAPDESRLAGKYRELWDENELELAFDPEDRSRPYFAELAGGGLLGYRSEVTDNYTPAGVARVETQLIETVVEFYECFHTWRQFAEEHLGITLDEVLQVTQTEKRPFDDFTGPTRLDEETCRDVLEGTNLYIEQHKESMEKIGEVFTDGPPKGRTDLTTAAIEAGGALSEYDLDDVVDEHVEELANFCGTWAPDGGNDE